MAAMSSMLATLATTTSSSASYACPLKSKQLLAAGPSRAKPHRFHTNINSSTSITDTENDADTGPRRVDRRNVLLGLGGLSAATSLVPGSQPAALADPVMPPDLNACHAANYTTNGVTVNVQCCPPYDLSKPIDIQPYVLPTDMRIRKRRPAHLLTQYEKDRFSRAISEMKKLPKDHPWNYLQQAQIHCAYCNEAYDQKGFPDVSLQVHFSALFLPWHRWYVYFYERILGKLIDDDTFALPFWTYDIEAGMPVPEIYKDSSSSLYDANRNQKHMDELLNLLYSYSKEDDPVSATVVQDNINYLRRIFKEGMNNPELFMGEVVKAGQAPGTSTTMGQLESMHNVVHMWCGSFESPNFDMGNFATAARDLLFFAHHANVDRLWHLYRAARGHKVEFDDPNWLNATFIFYDEDQKIVSVKIEDTFNTLNFGYVYEDVPTQVLDPKPIGSAAKTRTAGKISLIKVSEFGSSPRELTDTIRAVVKRPKANRSATEKGNETEILFIDDIVVTDPEPVRFDVYVNTLYNDSLVAGLGELAGSFTKTRHNHTLKDGSLKKVKFKLGINGVVEDLGADAAEKLVVTLVPGSGSVTIGGIHIELVTAQS